MKQLARGQHSGPAKFTERQEVVLVAGDESVRFERLRHRQQVALESCSPEPAGPLETPWYAFTMKKRPDWPKLPGWKTFKGLQDSRGFGTPPSVLRELVAQGKKRRQKPATPAPRSPERAAKGARSRAAK